MSGIPPNTFKRRLADRTPQLGFWLSLNSLAATEIAAGAGFDWLLLDMEHTSISIERIEQHLLAARHGGDTELVVRIPINEPIMVKRLLDSGIRSFMFPFVQSADEARAAVAATRYPPLGSRSFAGAHRGNRFSRDTTYFTRAHEDICVIVQIESPQAVEAIPQIGEIEGVDGMFIGPNDLAANLGFLGQPTHPTVRAKFAEALALMMATTKAPGILEYNTASARSLLADGFSFIAVGADSSVLLRGTQQLLETIRASGT